MFLYVAAALYPARAADIKWSPSSNMDGQLFPSLIIATATVRPDADEKNAPEVLGDAYGIVGISITSPAAHTKVRLTLQENALMNRSSWSGELAEKGTDYYIAPDINYKFDQLRKARQQVPLNVTFELEVNGKRVGEQHETITVRSINDCPYAVADSEETIAEDDPETTADSDGSSDAVTESDDDDRKSGGIGKAITGGQKIQDDESEEEDSDNEAAKDDDADDGSTDLGWMFAAYVNEGSPAVEKVLQEALASRLVNHFAGYQGSDDDVLREVFAVWAALQARGIHYSSITTTAGNSKTVSSQHVRFVDESLQDEQANCVDGSVLFCSILRKLGLRTFLVNIPGHMYMGVYLTRDDDNRIAIETTMIGAGVSESEEKIKTIKPLRSLKGTLDNKTRASAAWRTFEAAVAEGTENLNNDRSKFEDDDNAEYQITDIDEARADGIMPISAD